MNLNGNSEPQWSNLLKDTGLLKIRCPQCLKLFSIKTDEIKESRPKYKCSACTQIFWISYLEALDSKEETLGFPIEWLETDSQEAQPKTPDVIQEKCPKCETPYTENQKECTKCGVIFAKIPDVKLAAGPMTPSTDSDNRAQVKDSNPSLPPHSPEASLAWENVIENFEDPNAHQNFIQMCQATECLEYAEQIYADLLNLCPQDALLSKSLAQVQALQTVRTEMTKAPQYDDSVVARVKESDVFQNVLGFFYKLLFRQTPSLAKKISWSGAILIACAIMITIGILIPPLRNLVGVGCSLAFIVLALKYF